LRRKLLHRWKCRRNAMQWSMKRRQQSRHQDRTTSGGAAHVVCNRWYGAIQRKSQSIVMRYFNVLPPQCTALGFSPYGHSNQHFGIMNARDWSTYWCRYHGTCDCQYGRIHVGNCTTIFGILGDCDGRHLANVDTGIVGSTAAIGGGVCSYWSRWSCWFIWYDKSFWYSHFVVTALWTVW
jgi:hypothetical protein